ncbi:hypothetical protein C6P40_002477 [Pichia californica]|uniref:Zn(2)-C6 fungal-type domain-containing protein n=1 Tax=Pichia californica TaxID=460514 RepID=A0A9P7BCU6_9ASCO|nr:hypothetical protein C6P42_002378 [[Candida] californica]KAG0687347.1 hypothetical protein C6P40_002477 [[Candida] californica]
MTTNDTNSIEIPDGLPAESNNELQSKSISNRKITNKENKPNTTTTTATETATANLFDGSKIIKKKRFATAGCLTCRQRHKRCSRERPVCSTCSKTEYTCFWREPGTKFTEYKVKLIYSKNPLPIVLKPNKLINPNENILSTEFNLSDCNDETELDFDSNNIINDENSLLIDESLISVAQKAVSITNAYMNSQEMLKNTGNDVMVKKELDDNEEEEEDDDEDDNDNEEEEEEENEKNEEDEEDDDNDEEKPFIKKEEDSDSDNDENSNNNNYSNEDNDDSNHIKKEFDADDNFYNDDESSNFNDVDDTQSTAQKIIRDENLQNRLNLLIMDQSTDIIINEGTKILKPDFKQKCIESWYGRYLDTDESSNKTKETTSSMTTSLEENISSNQVNSENLSNNPLEKPTEMSVELLALVPFGYEIDDRFKSSKIIESNSSQRPQHSSNLMTNKVTKQGKMIKQIKKTKPTNKSISKMNGISIRTLQKMKTINSVSQKLYEKPPTKQISEKITPILDLVISDAIKSNSLIKPTSMLQSAARIRNKQPNDSGNRESKQLFQKTKEMREAGKISKEDAALLLSSTFSAKRNKKKTSKSISSKMALDGRRKFATSMSEPA